MRTRDEHLEWCKKNALEYLDAGNIQDAICSMISDLNKHEETKSQNEYLLALGIIYATNCDYDGARRWITGWR